MAALGVGLRGRAIDWSKLGAIVIHIHHLGRADTADTRRDQKRANPIHQHIDRMATTSQNGPKKRMKRRNNNKCTTKRKKKRMNDREKY